MTSLPRTGRFNDFWHLNNVTVQKQEQGVIEQLILIPKMYFLLEFYYIYISV